MHLPTSALFALAPFFLGASAQGASGSGRTTRYWDCCKPSCAWPRKGNAPQPVRTCDKNDNPLNDGGNTRSGCDSGGSAYMCSAQSPWAVNETVAYGWAAVNIAGSNEAAWCCACYELTFTSGPVAGKKMIVQATNTGGDLGNNHFDIAVRSLSFFVVVCCLPLIDALTKGFPPLLSPPRSLHSWNRIKLAVVLTRGRPQMPGGGVGIFNGKHPLSLLLLTYTGSNAC